MKTKIININCNNNTVTIRDNILRGNFHLLSILGVLRAQLVVGQTRKSHAR